MICSDVRKVVGMNEFLKFYLDEQFNCLKQKLECLEQKFDLLQAIVKEAAASVATLVRKGDKIMGALNDLSDGIGQLGTAQTDQASSLTNIAADIKHLQEQVANGGGITEAQLQPLADKVKAAAKASSDAAATMKALADSVPDVVPGPPDGNP